MPRPPEYANFPFDFHWWFVPNIPQGHRDAGPGRCRLVHLDSQQYWDIHIVHLDKMAQEHMQNRMRKPGQPVNMGAHGIKEIPYYPLDEEADALLQRGMRPNPDRSDITVLCSDGFKVDKCPRDWWEQLAAGHINRRKQEPAVQLQMGQNKTVSLTFECFDAMCKDFMRRRGDMISSGIFPELVDPYRDVGQLKGPKPVDGRANAMGYGAQVLQGQNAQPPGPGGQGAQQPTPAPQAPPLPPGAPPPQQGAHQQAQPGTHQPFENEGIV